MYVQTHTSNLGFLLARCKRGQAAGMMLCQAGEVSQVLEGEGRWWWLLPCLGSLTLLLHIAISPEDAMSISADVQRLICKHISFLIHVNFINLSSTIVTILIHMTWCQNSICIYFPLFFYWLWSWATSSDDCKTRTYLFFLLEACAPSPFPLFLWKHFQHLYTQENKSRMMCILEIKA